MSLLRSKCRETQTTKSYDAVRLDRYRGGNANFVLVWWLLSCGFEADGVNESVEIISDALVEPIKLRALLRAETAI